MIIFWIGKNGKNQTPREVMEESFRKHDEYMKKFRDGHPGEPVTTKDCRWTAGMNLAGFPPVKLNCNSQN
ncbi:MAG: hypothetical protein PHR56_04645 [Dehalococcoidales bacterium]|nr:hypothetical protein [Dehalococcoidales bacterium]